MMTCLAYLMLLALILGSIVMLFIHPLLTLLGFILVAIVWHGIHTGKEAK